MARLEVRVGGDARVFHPDPRLEPAGLADYLARKGLALNTRCSQRGLCEGCEVVVREGRLALRGGGFAEASEAPVLGCQCLLEAGTEAVVEIPARSLLGHKPSVVADFKTRVAAGGEALLGAGGEGAVGAAVDIGTTTVVVAVADLAEGTILARASAFNRQIEAGDDVLSRIELCCGDKSNVARLQRLVGAETVLPLLREALQAAGVEPRRLAGLCVSGNTTMLHLLAGVDPSPIGVAPFTPEFLEHRVMGAGAVLGPDSGLPDVPVHLLPGLAAYVGADIAAGVLCTGLHYEEEPMLLVDVGTNGEIVLRRGRRTLACATAAGPAFEGCGLTCGMRATTGAVSGIHAGGAGLGSGFRLDLKTIGGVPAARAPGICGTGYVDFLAQGRLAGWLGEAGRFEEEAVAANPERFVKSEYGRALLLAPEDGGRLRITEPDVALLLQAKAAIAAGIQTLLEREGLATRDVKRLYLAGGFGLHLDIGHAIGSGLLPGFAPEQVEAVGNTSLGGAWLAMLDRTVVDEMDRLRKDAEIVELNLDPGFEDRYVENMMLP